MDAIALFRAPPAVFGLSERYGPDHEGRSELWEPLRVKLRRSSGPGDPDEKATATCTASPDRKLSAMWRLPSSTSVWLR